MTTVVRTADLEAMAEEYRRATRNIRQRVIVCAGTGCVASGSLKVYEALLHEIAKWGLDVEVQLKAEAVEGQSEPTDRIPAKFLVSRSGCQGFCQMGPLVSILPQNVFYVRVKPEDVPEIVQKTLLGGETVDHLLFVDSRTKKRVVNTEQIDFYTKQHRLVLAQCGLIDPENILEYIGLGGYSAAQQAFIQLTPAQICQIITEAGLRGRGGGGFPTGLKWDAARQQPGDIKYVICNGDEGDPGAFMDRSVMEGNPHAVIEGMLIAARAIGAHKGYLYVRAEYPLAVHRLRRAIDDAYEVGLLGDDLFGTNYAVDIELMEGAGAFVCGEETALIASIEGQRGMPRPKPPFPAQSGLWGKPTVINNVETLATVPLIIREGPQRFRALGTPSSPGTKTFALTGHVPNTGLIEVPFGATLRHIIFDIGGGVTDGKGRIREDAFKAVQIGGPSGGCLTHEHLDL
ncbi:MAG: NADH-quinone oxidoreductase subunit F, partial [Candidatus Sumerlaeaceae bacterium]